MSTSLTHSWRIVLAAFLGVGSIALSATAADAADASGPTWSVLSPPTSPPSLRYAAAAYDGADQTVVAFGGELATGRLSDATWIWDGTTWSQVVPYGAVPPARDHASMAYDPALQQLVLFGGQGADGTLLDDTWVWNGASWDQLTTADSPGARDGAAFAAGPDGDLVLYGGYGHSNAPAPASDTSTSTSSSTAVHRNDATTSTSSTDSTTTTTSPATTTTTVPPVRATVETGVLDDTWTLGPTGSGSEDWQPVATTTSPPPLAGAAMAADGSTTVLVGGVDGPPGTAVASGPAGTWTWDGSRWRAVRSRHAPTARTDAVAADDPALGGVVLFGGQGPSGPLGDTWLWTGGSWSRLAVGTPPAARAGALGADDQASRQLVVFGGVGSGGDHLGQTAVLSAEAPTPVTTGSGSSGSTTTTTGSAGSTTTSRSGSTSSTGRSAGSGGGASGGTQLAAATTTLRRGDVVTLTGRGFVAGARVTITFGSSPSVVVATTRADADGAFRVEVSVPDDAGLGTHRFVASGRGPHGTTTLATEVRVVALSIARHLSTLARAGLTALAVAIPLATWLVLAGANRARRRTPPATSG
jgi:hypothetical protein